MEKNNQPMPTQQKVIPWKEALKKAQNKFLAISGKEYETKIEMGFAAMLLEGNEKLRQCEPSSIINAIINVARTGITLNPILKLAHLIPRKGKCVLEFDYKGLVKILKDNGCIKDIQAIIVYEDEKFEESYSPIVRPTHEKKYAKTEKEQLKRQYTGVYCQVLLSDNTVIYTQFTPYWEILKAEKVSTSASSEHSPWQRDKWREEMIKKTKIRKDFKTLISGSPDNKVLAALEVEQENDEIQLTNGNEKQTMKITSKNIQAVFGDDDFDESQDITDKKTVSKTLNNDSSTPHTDFIDQEADKQREEVLKEINKKVDTITPLDDSPPEDVINAINNNATLFPDQQNN